MENLNTITVKTSELIASLKHVLASRAKFEKYNLLSNVVLKVVNDVMIEFVATDGNMLAIDRIGLVETMASDFIGNKYILTNCDNLLKILDKKIKTTCIDLSTLKVSQYNNEFKLLQDINSNYPKYEQLIQNYNEDSLQNINYSNDDNIIKIAFNREYLKQILSNMEKTKTEIVTMGIVKEGSTSLHPLMINNKDTEYLQFNLLMPMLLR